MTTDDLTYEQIVEQLEAVTAQLASGDKGIEAATGVDVAGAIMDLLQVQAGDVAPGRRARRSALRST